MTDTKEILTTFGNKLLSDNIDIDVANMDLEMMSYVNDNFWELLSDECQEEEKRQAVKD